MHAATDSVELARLRVRVDGLVQRRLAAVERLGPLPGSPSHHHLEAIRVELCELEWQLANLEALARS
jgi:hypothetical protein